MENMIVMFILAGAILALAIFCFALQRRARRLADASRSWPSVTGEVESSGLLTMAGRTTPVLFYRYTVAGQEYRSNRLQFGGQSHFFNSDAYERLCGMEKGDAVPVFYDPERPGRAVLHQAPDTSLPGTVGCALVVLAVLLGAVGLATLA